MDAPPILGKSVVYTYLSAKPNPVTTKVIISLVIILVLAILLVFLILWIIRKSGKDTRVSDTNVALLQAKRTFELNSLMGEGFVGEIVLGDVKPVGKESLKMESYNSLYAKLLTGVVPEQQFLVNLCPLTASIGGYIGPLENGVFNAEYYVRKALRAGIRSFVLPISTYYDDTKTPPNWPYSGKPAIVCRKDNGKIQSINGMSIKKFCETIVMYKSENRAHSDEPILIYLDATPGYIPDSVKKEKEYVKFTSDIASELSPLDPYRLVLLGAYGSAVGGLRQAEILTQTPLIELKDKVLLFTNFDVNIATKKDYSSITPLLYNYVNFLYKPVTATNIGTTSTGQSGSRSIHLADIGGSNVNWTDQARVTWHVTTGDSFNSVPTAEGVNGAATIGIQAVPIPFFAVDLEKTQAIWKQWEGYAWRLKPENARYTKPPPIVPHKPSTTLNARVDNNLQPGQLSVK